MLAHTQYEHPNFSDLTNYVDELASSGKNIYHVEGTNWAIQLSDDLVVPSAIVGVSL